MRNRMEMATKEQGKSVSFLKNAPHEEIRVVAQARIPSERGHKTEPLCWRKEGYQPLHRWLSLAGAMHPSRRSPRRWGRQSALASLLLCGNQDETVSL
jgi:hypothetical protein